MWIRSVVLAMLAIVGAALPVAAQSAVTGRATVAVPDLLEVRVTEAGEERLGLEVVANRRWELQVVVEDESGRSWSAGRVVEGGPGRMRVALSYGRLLEATGAPAATSVRFTLGPG